jgi:hypothetical protein
MVHEFIDGVRQNATGHLRADAVVQWGARRRGSDGIHGNPGDVVSVSYKF